MLFFSATRSSTFVLRNPSVQTSLRRMMSTKNSMQTIYGTLADALNSDDAHRDELLERYSLYQAAEFPAETRRNYSAVGRSANDDGTCISNLILPNHSRLVLHATAGLVSLEIDAPKEDSHFASFVGDFAKEIEAHIPPRDLAKRRAEISQSITDYVDGDILQTSTRPSWQINFERHSSIITERVARGNFDLRTEQVEKIAISLTANDVLNQEETRRISELTAKQINILIREERLTPLSMVGFNSETGTHEPLTIFQAGPSGTGKSVTLSHQLRDFPKKQFAQLSIDRMRTVLYGLMSLPDSEILHIGSFTHDEAVRIYNEAQEIYHKKLMARSPVSNVILEQCIPYSENLDPFLRAEGVVVMNISVRCPWETLKGVRQRALESGDPRQTPIDRVLSAYQMISPKIASMLRERKGENLVVNFFNTEEYLQAKFNGGRSVPLKPFAVANCNVNRLYILDLKLFKTFINFRNIATSPSSKENLYSTVEFEQLAQTMLEEYGNMDICLINPECDDSSVNALQSNIIARIDAKGKIHEYESKAVCEYRKQFSREFDALTGMSSKESIAPRL